MKLATIMVAGLLLLAACGSGQSETAPPPTQTPSPTTASAAIAEPTASPTATLAPSPTTIQEPPPTPTVVFDPGPVIMPTVAIPTATPSVTPDDPLQARLGHVGSQTSLLRNLFVLREIAREFITQDELNERLASAFEEDRDEIAQIERLYKTLGILAPETVLYDLLIDIHSETVLGFYDPDEEKLFVLGASAELPSDEVLTYSHEYTHGLQQQYFDIKSMHEAVEDNYDRSAALRALREGDATITEILYMFNILSEEQQREVRDSAAGQQTEILDSAPHVIRRTFVFPYREGFLFVATLFQNSYDESGWQVINDAYTEVPESTEQILHPDKFAAREPPISVELPNVAAALGDSWTQVTSNTTGEFFLLAYLESGLPPERASLAAAGWGGDAYVLLKGPNDENLLAMQFTWDTDADAQEFFDIFLEFLSARSGGVWELVGGDTGRQQLTSDDQSVFISIDAADTVLVFAPDTETVQVVLGAFETAR